MKQTEEKKKENYANNAHKVSKIRTKTNLKIDALSISFCSV